MPMTSEAKSALSKTIRSLRERLLEDLQTATESTYRFSIRPRDAGLDEAALTQRRRLEDWIEEQRRAEAGAWTRKNQQRTADDFRREAEKQAAYTLLNRLVILRVMETPGPNSEPLRSPPVVTGGWESRAYKDFRSLAPALVRQDETEGYGFLLDLVFQDLATVLPGLYGLAGIAELIPIPASTLRHVVEELDKPELESCWTDDMTLGWVYQYWNDPEREVLDAKLHAGGKLEPHEIASKTQMFTERYIVDWLLQNSLGPMWLAMCRKHGWTAEAETPGPDGQNLLDRLEARRVEWRAKREVGEVFLTELMPLHDEAERRWAYYVPQPIPDDAIEHAPKSVRELRILDPAVGSGHFLVVAFDLLVALYREEACHRGETGDARWSDASIVESILEHNLHGIDLDPRAVQMAAAALWLKARQTCPGVRPRHLNLVASNLHLADLPGDDPAVVELRQEVEEEIGLPGKITDTLVHALRGADHLGSLLKVNRAVDEALDRVEWADTVEREPVQDDLFEGQPAQQIRLGLDREAGRQTVFNRIESFLARHSGGEDLGLRLRGEQLAAGVRFVRMLQEGRYDLVVGNPPYQGTSKMAEDAYVKQHYAQGKADLYAAFLERGLQLVRWGGVSALLTMRNWMFIRRYSDLRQWLLESWDLRALGDFEVGAFEEVGGMVVSVCASVFHRCRPLASTVALRLVCDDSDGRSGDRTIRKRAATLCHVRRHEFDPAALKVVPEWPLVYWWPFEVLQAYERGIFGEDSPAKKGMITSDNTRFIRLPHEVSPPQFGSWEDGVRFVEGDWQPLMSGAKGRRWIEPLCEVLWWDRLGIEVKLLNEFKYRSYTRQIMNEDWYFKPGVAFTCIGSDFGGRLHRYASIISSTGCSVYGQPRGEVVCQLNSSWARELLSALNPTVHFTNDDVNRLPIQKFAKANDIVNKLQAAFNTHEAHREPSVEFRHPGPSSWRHAQEWAQEAVDRPEGAPLPPYEEKLDPEPPTDHLSFALGVALGRFGPDGEGILDPTKDSLDQALPAGICFLDGTLDAHDRRDSLAHPAAEPLREAWQDHGPAVDPKSDLRTWLRLRFFGDIHKRMYENRPIHWPLTSDDKTFVAWINIHRWEAKTLRVLLADHLHPSLSRLEGELDDLRSARSSDEPKARRAAERRYDEVLKQKEELETFIRDVEQCADRGPLPLDPKCPPREQDARYDPDLDDGVMINSAALWRLLEPQWKEPKTWWKELTTAKGQKDYDWSHLAMRYWPTRVDEMCQEDPSLGVAHGCFWRYHPERAWAWELRLQDEIGPDFRIEEAPYRPGGRELGDQGDGPHREAWIREHPEEALEALEKEATRRMGRGKDKKIIPEMRILEPGLWSTLSEKVWEMEIRLTEKQESEFRLLAPDEPDARVAFEQANPKKVAERRKLVSSLESARQLFDDQGATDGAGVEPSGAEA